jgi:hypothetical protein
MKHRRLTRDEVAKLVVKASSTLVKAAATQMPSPCRQRRRGALVPLMFPVLDEEYTTAETRRMRSRAASRSSGCRRSPSSRLTENRCSVPACRGTRRWLVWRRGRRCRESLLEARASARRAAAIPAPKKRKKSAFLQGQATASSFGSGEPGSLANQRGKHGRLHPASARPP